MPIIMHTVTDCTQLTYCAVLSHRHTQQLHSKVDASSPSTHCDTHMSIQTQVPSVAALGHLGQEGSARSKGQGKRQRDKEGILLGLRRRRDDTPYGRQGSPSLVYWVHSPSLLTAPRCTLTLPPHSTLLHTHPPSSQHRVAHSPSLLTVPCCTLTLHLLAFYDDLGLSQCHRSPATFPNHYLYQQPTIWWCLLPLRAPPLPPR